MDGLDHSGLRHLAGPRGDHLVTAGREAINIYIAQATRCSKTYPPVPRFKHERYTSRLLPESCFQFSAINCAVTVVGLE